MAEWLEPWPLSARSAGSRGCEFKARPNIVNFNIAKMRLKTSYTPLRLEFPVSTKTLNR